MNCINIGSGGYIPVEKVIAAFDYSKLNSVRDLVKTKKSEGRYMDFAFPKACKTIIILSTGDIVGSLFTSENITKRLSEAAPENFLAIYRRCCINKMHIVLMGEKNNAASRVSKVRSSIEIKLNAKKIRSVIWTSAGYVFYTSKSVEALKNTKSEDINEG